MSEGKSNYNYYASEEYKEKLEELSAYREELLEQKAKEAVEKDKQVKSEVRKLKKIFTENRCGKENNHFVLALIERAAFLRVELDYTEKRLQQEGVIDFFQQGLQTMWREHPLAKVHVQFVKNYKDVITKLEGYCKDEAKDAGTSDSFSDLLGRGSKAREKYKK